MHLLRATAAEKRHEHEEKRLDTIIRSAERMNRLIEDLLDASRIERGSLGVDLRPVALPTDLPVDAMLVTLSVEAAAAFDELTRTRGVDAMVRQTKDAWPHVFRTSRFVPAVEYLQANRARTVLMQRTAEALRDVDVFVAPSFQGGTLGITNLTGHPAVCVPNAFHPAEGRQGERRSPGSVTFVGGLYRDAAALALAHAYQQATDFHRRRPPIR